VGRAEVQDVTGPTAYARAANDPDVLQHCEAVVEEWCTQTEGLLVQVLLARHCCTLRIVFVLS